MATKTEDFIESFALETTRSDSNSRIAMISTHGYVAADPPLGKPDTGGQVVYVLELSRKLAQLGYRVDIWTRQFEGQKAVEEVDEDVRLIRVPCGGHEFIAKEFLHKNIPEWCRNALRRIENEHIAYEFINSHYWDAGLAGQTLSESLGCAHIHTPHSLGTWKKQEMETDFPDDIDSFEETYNFTRRIRSEGNIYRSANFVVATSPIQLDRFKQDYDIQPGKLIMIPPGYDDNRFFPVSQASRDAIREQFGFDGPVVASIGRLSRNKGFDLLIDAFSLVAERFENAKLFMPLGSESKDQAEDPMLDEIVNQIHALGLEKRVKITGSLPEEVMPDFYRAVDVFCLPSRYEPFGMTAVEAMASGAPAVVTTHGGLYRTLQYGINALYADSFDKLDFGITICKVLEYESLRNRLSENGAKIARSLFTWTGIAQQLIAVVEGTKFPRYEISPHFAPTRKHLL